ncbi:haloacid dehalogenase type II [Polynucleobacter kasalickyi]|uniref:(S)-2-haloacid dehalogenase n=1 Tax=Polynucleobacter kasalickyi TaxID=1938817 RepID=A0A1W1YXZ8_9BURK|nr:haloacid dehalogenase type II [Polynucleobacter kasalickyi]SMC40996.1 2-haloacid dehalogenase [Polynucleobacter kasalickyi]
MYKLVAFDAYGTLFDVYSMGQLAEELFPGHGEIISVMWRDRQIEYTRLVTMSDPNPLGSKYYLPFWEITIRALRYVCKRLQLSLTAQKELLLMTQYAKLSAFADASSVLQALKQKGLATAILSNGSREMLKTVVSSNGLEGYLDQVVTVEEVRLFKTAPQSYQLLIDAFSIKKEEILFVSSNAWDVVGAAWFGYDVFWVNRSQLPFEEIGEPPHYEGRSLSDLPSIFHQEST